MYDTYHVDRVAVTVRNHFVLFANYIRRHSKLLLQYALVIVAFVGFSAYQQRNLLATDRQSAPSLEAFDLQGNAINLATFAGRPVLVYFFAPWCRYCAASADNIARLRRIRQEEKLAIVVVALEWQDPQELQDYSDYHELNVPVLAGDATVANDWKVFGFPTYYVLDSEHRVVSRDFGYSTQLGLWWRTWL